MRLGLLEPSVSLEPTSEPGFERAFWHRTLHFVHDPAIAKYLEGGNRSDAESACRGRVIVDVEFDDLEPAAAFACQLFEHGAHHSARPTPGRPEIDQDRDGRVLDYFAEGPVSGFHRDPRKQGLMTAATSRTVPQAVCWDTVPLVTVWTGLFDGCSLSIHHDGPKVSRPRLVASVSLASIDSRFTLWS